MIKIGFVSAISSDGLVSVSYPDEDDATTDFMPLLEGNPLEVDDMVAVAYTSSAQSVCLGKIIGR